MRVRVLVFGVLKDLAPEQSGEIDLPDGSTVSHLLEIYRNRFGYSDALRSSMAVAVNREYVTGPHLLREGDEVALLPPVSGGNRSMAALVRSRIDSEEIVARIKQGDDGAVVVFDGIVRNNTRGRRTLHLVYEAYEEMALTQMRGIAEKAIADFGVRDVAIVHRLGLLEVGETSVLIVVASAHRAQAFDASRWLIDTLKKTVPIWKKEHFEDGAVWADGEPFPAAIVAEGQP